MGGQALQRADAAAAVGGADLAHTYTRLLERVVAGRADVARIADVVAELASAPPAPALTATQGSASSTTPASDTDEAGGTAAMPVARRLEGFLRIGQGGRGERRLAAFHVAVVLVARMCLRRLADPATGPAAPVLSTGALLARVPAVQVGPPLPLVLEADPAAVAWWRAVAPSRLLAQPALAAVDAVAAEVAGVRALVGLARATAAVAPGAMPSSGADPMWLSRTEAGLERIAGWAAGTPSALTMHPRTH
jgi:hypothetical protein